MISVTVEFKGYLKQYTGHREPLSLELQQDTQVEAVFTHFNIPAHLIKLVSIDGTMVEKTQLLKDGDHIVVLGG